MSTINYKKSTASVVTRENWERRFLNAETKYDQYAIITELLDHIDTMEENKFYVRQRHGNAAI